MAVSTAAILTQQFYEWEQRGRGWHKEDFSVDLEPPFAPFFGHFLPESDIIDDGRSPSFFQRLFNTPSLPTQAVLTKEPELKAYPSTDNEGLSVFLIDIPKYSKAHAEQMEQLLIMLSYLRSTISFELIATADKLIFQLACKDRDAQYLQTQLHAFFPGFGIQETFDDHVEYSLRARECIYTVDFGLKEEFTRPIAMLSGDKECYTALFGTLDRLSPDESVIIQILFSGVCNPWSEHVLNAVQDNDGKGSFFLDDPDMVKFAHMKVSHPLCAATMRAMTFSETLGGANLLLQHVATALIHTSKNAGNVLMPLSDNSYTVHQRMADMLMRESRRVGMLLNTGELCTIAHFPLVPLPKLGQQRNTKAVPTELIGNEYCIGLNVHQGVESEVTLRTEHRLRHIHILGSTGTGKSTFLHSLMMQDVELGNGFMCLDPHGDLIDKILDTIPQERMKDVVLIDPSDSAYPIGFNILSAHSELEKELLASDLVALFRRFSTSWGDQMNSVFANAILAFLYNTKVGTLADLRRFLIEPTFRAQQLATVTDIDLIYYWQHEYPLLKSSSIGSILTRLDAFLRPKIIRNMVCQQSSLDFAKLMDSNKIILVKLSQGLLGAENSYLLGAFIVSKLQQIAMARQAQSKDARVPFYCYIDEFHNFTTPSMSEILSGARKYALGLILAHQDMAQVQKQDNDIAGSLLSNAGVRVCFRMGDTDAKRFQDGFASFTADDLQNLAVGDAIVRVNTVDTDCSLTVIPFEIDDDSYKEDIIEHSRASYSAGIVKPTVSPEPSPASKPLSPPPVSEAVTVVERPVIKKEQPTTPREHIYLQNFIKGLAEEAGYKTQLEVKTPDGKGQVDVLLEKDGKRIAVEISVTTAPDWELHNIQKCIAAGYDQVVVCSNDEQKRKAIETMVQSSLSKFEQDRIVIISPQQFQLFLNSGSANATNETVMKGYRIKIKYEENGNRQDILQSIIAASRKA